MDQGISRTDRLGIRPPLVAIVSIVLLTSILGAKERRGATLLVTRNDGTVVKGELLAVKGENLILMSESAREGITENIGELKIIRVIKKPKVFEGIGIGVLVGGAAGGTLGAAAWSGDALFETRGEAALVTSALFGAIGGFLGGLIGGLASVDANIPVKKTDPVYISFIAGKLRRLARDPAVS